MVRRARWASTTATLALATALATGCTSTPTSPATPSATLTVGGTAYPLPPTTAPPTTAPPTTAPPTTNTPTSPAPPATISITQPTTPPTTPPLTPTTTPTASTTPPLTPQRSRTTRPPTPDTAGLSAREIADRKAIQAVWIHFWSIYRRINYVPADQRLPALAAVSVNPLEANILKSARDYDTKGLTTYGDVVHRIYWGPSVGGKSPAIMGDCLDTSRYGTLEVKTQMKVTSGLARDNTRAVFVLGSDEKWRIQSIESLIDQSC